MVFYLLLVVVYFSARIFKSKPDQRVREVLIAAAYIAGAEVFFRMTKAYFLYETGKYLVMLFMIVGMFYDGFKRKAYPYAIFLLLLLPGVLVSFQEISYDEKFRQAVMFNLSGPLTLSLVSIYTYGKVMTYKNFLRILNFLVYPIISMTVYIVLYNPDLRDVITNTAASVAASGGYGPNQVATALGLGVFILFSRLLIPYKNKWLQLLMMSILALIAYRGILTFSRGGMLTALIMCIAFLISFFLFANLKSKVRTIFKIIGVMGVIVLIWTISLMQTGGLIENRYTNKDALGRDKGDITTGRVEIATTEFDAFLKHPFFGVGVGQMKFIRKEQTGINAASHNEISRMFSEHGLFGIFALMILIIAPIANNPFGIKNIYIYPLLLFWFLTINHSAMRIAAPAFIYGLSLITITREKKNTLHR